MNRQEAHDLVDKIFDGAAEPPELGIVGDTLEAPVRILPEGKRVARTKTSGDRVYLIDEIKKTRQWVTNPEVLKSLGFEVGDVVEIEDSELLRYQMGAAIYKVDGQA